MHDYIDARIEHVLTQHGRYFVSALLTRPKNASVERDFAEKALVEAVKSVEDGGLVNIKAAKVDVPRIGRLIAEALVHVRQWKDVPRVATAKKAIKCLDAAYKIAHAAIIEVKWGKRAAR